MGGLGAVVGQEAGGGLGGLIGRRIGGRAGGAAGANIGRAAGGLVGAAFPFFKKGGKVPGQKGKPRLAVVHGGEYVLPVGVAPTAAQKKAVAKRKAKK